MNESWKHWEGQVVDGEFPLQRYLGGSAHSAVYLTETSAPEPQKAALKLFPLDARNADLQLSRWAMAAKLSHANLLRIFHTGRCRLGATDLLYVVMEYAEEDLSQILPQRPLTPAEARDMLEPVLDALVYLHGKGFVHGHLKPANIMAIADQLKISSDGLCALSDSTAPLPPPSAYDPPERASAGFSFAGDVWSLAMTLVEVLTQRLLVWDPSEQRVPELPQKLPQPFLDIVRHSLQRDPQLRWTVGDIAARLQPNPPAHLLLEPSSVAAPLPGATDQALPQQTPAAAPLPGQPSLEPARQKQIIATSALPGAGRRAKPLRPATPVGLSEGLRLQYLVPVAAAALALIVIFTGIKFFTHRSTEQPAASAALNQPPVPAKVPANAPAKAQPKSAPLAKEPASTTSKPRPVPPSALPPAPGSLKTTSGAKPASAAAAPAPALLRSELPAKTTAAGPGRGEVLDQVLPEVSEKARNTIHGTVRVTVRVQVDRSGSVTSAALDEPGSSKYFADLALQAARRWEFQPPEVDARSVPSEWLLRFYFTQSAIKAVPEQAAP